MKKYIFIICAIALSLFIIPSSAQNINWRNLPDEQARFVNLNVGWDFGSTIGVGYGAKLKTKLPVVLNTEFSLPLGKNLLDDFKVKVGGQTELFRLGNFSGTLKIAGVFRRYENNFTRMLNFGSEFSGEIGYYKQGWYAAGEFGFDKAIATHIKSSPETKEYMPTSLNGWYVPTGGNFFYGIQTGVSVKKNDFSVRLGKLKTQDFKSSPMIPFYLQIGVKRRF